MPLADVILNLCNFIHLLLVLCHVSRSRECPNQLTLIETHFTDNDYIFNLITYTTKAEKYINYSIYNHYCF